MLCCRFSCTAKGKKKSVKKKKDLQHRIPSSDGDGRSADRKRRREASLNALARRRKRERGRGEKETGGGKKATEVVNLRQRANVRKRKSTRWSRAGQQAQKRERNSPLHLSYPLPLSLTGGEGVMKGGHLSPFYEKRERKRKERERGGRAFPFPFCFCDGRKKKGREAGAYVFPGGSAVDAEERQKGGKMDWTARAGRPSRLVCAAVAGDVPKLQAGYLLVSSAAKKFPKKEKRGKGEKGWRRTANVPAVWPLFAGPRGGEKK